MFPGFVSLSPRFTLRGQSSALPPCGRASVPAPRAAPVRAPCQSCTPARAATRGHGRHRQDGMWTQRAHTVPPLASPGPWIRGREWRRRRGWLPARRRKPGAPPRSPRASPTPAQPQPAGLGDEPAPARTRSASPGRGAGPPPGRRAPAPPALPSTGKAPPRPGGARRTPGDPPSTPPGRGRRNPTPSVAGRRGLPRNRQPIWVAGLNSVHAKVRNTQKQAAASVVAMNPAHRMALQVTFIGR